MGDFPLAGGHGHSHRRFDQHPRELIEADQRFLNSAVDSGRIRDLTGKNSLEPDGIEGKKTIRVRQLLLFNTHGPAVLFAALSSIAVGAASHLSILSKRIPSNYLADVPDDPAGRHCD